MALGPSWLLNFEANPVKCIQVRIAERSVEGRHSRIHRILKRAPRAGVAYLSLEMRFPLLQELAATKPDCLKHLLGSWTKLETAAGMRRAVMSPRLCLEWSVNFVLCYVALCVSGSQCGNYLLNLNNLKHLLNLFNLLSLGIIAVIRLSAYQIRT